MSTRITFNLDGRILHYSWTPEGLDEDVTVPAPALIFGAQHIFNQTRQRVEAVLKATKIDMRDVVAFSLGDDPEQSLFYVHTGDQKTWAVEGDLQTILNKFPKTGKTYRLLSNIPVYMSSATACPSVELVAGFDDLMPLLAISDQNEIPVRLIDHISVPLDAMPHFYTRDGGKYVADHPLKALFHQFARDVKARDLLEDIPVLQSVRYIDEHGKPGVYEERRSAESYIAGPRPLV